MPVPSLHTHAQATAHPCRLLRVVPRLGCLAGAGCSQLLTEEHLTPTPAWGTQGLVPSFKPIRDRRNEPCIFRLGPGTECSSDLSWGYLPLLVSSLGVWSPSTVFRNNPQCSQSLKRSADTQWVASHVVLRAITVSSPMRLHDKPTSTKDR